MFKQGNEWMIEEAQKYVELILAQAEDKIEQSRTRGYITWTPFLDSHQQSVLRKAIAREDTGSVAGFYPADMTMQRG